MHEFDPLDIQNQIITISGKPVILDSDLAALFGVATKRLNEQVKRNIQKFEGYSFEMPANDFDSLKSQNATSKKQGGRRSLPRVFTEHGVVMAATVLSSDQAIHATRRIVEAFVAQKHQSSSTALVPIRTGFLEKLQGRLDQLMDTSLTVAEGRTVKEETQDFISRSLTNLKERLEKAGLENEEIQARVIQHLAEAEKAKAEADSARAHTEKQDIQNMANQLRLMIEAEIALTQGELSGFLEVLKDIGKG